MARFANGSRGYSKAPWVMLIGLLAGIAFAIGHHYFYLSLDRKAISDTAFNQQVNIAIGNAFAFLVKASLAIAVGSAYAQYLWHVLRHERLKVNHVDSLTGLLTSAMDFFNFGALKGHILLALMALLAWLMPLAAIVPPATLSVHASLDRQSSPQSIAIPDWNSFKFAQLRHGGGLGRRSRVDGRPRQDLYVGPQSYLTRLAWSTALQGTIPPISAPSLNATYTLQFRAPALSCQLTDDSVLADFVDVLGCDPRRTSQRTSNLFQYIAWTRTNPSADPPTPSNATDCGSAVLPDMTAGASLGPFDYTIPDPFDYATTAAALFIATNQSLVAKNQLGNVAPNWTVIKCSLWNSSYEVDFSWINGQQDIAVTYLEHLNGVSAVSHVETALGHGTQDVINMQAVMDVFGKLLVGFLWATSSFGGQYYNTAGTSVMSTRLAYTNELYNVLLNDISFQIGTVPPGPPLIPLSNALEQLFQNITLALFSDSYFANATKSNVTVTEYNTVNIYIYTWQRLVLSYSIAIVLTLLAVIAGYVFLFINGAAYTTKFSTILRTTRGTKFDELVASGEMTGADPIDKTLAKARICVGALNRDTIELDDGHESLTSDAEKVMEHYDGKLSKDTVESDDEHESLTSDSPTMMEHYEAHGPLHLPLPTTPSIAHTW